MKILVTGGAGFIGSHVVDKYVEKGHEVAVIDDLSSGKMENLSPKAKFYRGDITNQNFLEEVFSKEKPEIVNHLAAQISVSASVREPVKDISVNILGIVNILELARKYHIKKIIYSNSGAGYGNPVYLPMDEKHPLNPISPYGIDKHTAEHYLYMYLAVHGLNFVSLRYANVYGPRQDSSGEAGVISIFTNKILKNQQPTIFGDGTQTRDYIYVKDVVAANLLATESNILNNQCFNVGTGVQTSTQKIFDTIKELTSFPLPPAYSSERPGDAKDSSLDASRLKSFGWSPVYSLDKGLKETVAYVRNAH